MKHDAPQVIVAIFLIFNLTYTLATEDKALTRILGLGFFVFWCAMLYWGGFF